MGGVRWKISAGAVLLIALAYFFDTSGLLSAFVPAAAVHELGHALALRLCGSRVRRVSLSAFGLEMDYSGRLTGGRELLSIAAGPLAGLLFALAASSVGGTFWPMSGAISFLLSAFNLLPILPLDGGRLIAALTGPALARRLSRAAALVLLAAGGVLLAVYRSLSLLVMGLWLAVYNFR
ncbi:MAG: site-2 protease family protein [Oscillospiraceae bacterium]